MADPVRLSRRGRLVLALAVSAAAFVVVGIAQPPAFALGPGSGGPVAERVTVHQGDTLWAIAERVDPDADPRDTVARIASMNNLDSSALPAGSVLLVPTGG